MTTRNIDPVKSPVIMTRQLEAFSPAPLRARRVINAPLDAYRETFDEFVVGVDTTQRPQALSALRSELSHIGTSEVDSLIALITYAVSVEMKHWEDSLYTDHVDEESELLVDLIDYDGPEAVETATEDNRDKWEQLANNVWFAALAANAAADRSFLKAA